MDYNSFKEFYPYYLEQHQNITSRRLHFLGTCLVLIVLAYVITSENWQSLFILPLVGYIPAWVGHFFYEKNKPATFKYPIYSLLGDFKMFYEVITNKLNLR